MCLGRPRYNKSNKMIPVDIDNFLVYAIGDHYRDNWFQIEEIDIIPKELLNCVLLTNLLICDSNITNISILSNCKSLTNLYLYNCRMFDISILPEYINVSILFS